MKDFIQTMFKECPFEGYNGKRGLTGSSDSGVTLAKAFYHAGLMEGKITTEYGYDHFEYEWEDLDKCWADFISFILDVNDNDNG